jgi:ABC-type sugar transport system substrate-binding protein
MLRRPGVLILTLVTMTCLVLTGCAKDDSGGNAKSGGDGLTIGFVAAHYDTYFTSVRKGVEEAADKSGDKVIAVAYNDDVGKEAQVYQDLISRGVDVVVTSPWDAEGSVTGLKNLNNAGIRVVCYNACVNDKAAKQYVSAFIVSDNEALGTSSGSYAASFIKKELGGKASLAILNCDIAPVCKSRKTAFLAELKKQGIETDVVADQTSYQPDESVTVAQNMLTAHPEINVMFSATDGGGTGAISAIKSSGKTGKVHLFSVDISTALASAILSSDNILLGTTGQDGAAQGAAILEAVSQAELGKQLSPFQKLLPGVLYSVSDKENVDAWLAENK